MTNLNSNSHRIPQLDGIRGFAVLMIIIWHYGNVELTNNHTYLAECFKRVTAYCWTGVDLFFVLSGYLLGGILLKNKHATFYFITFYSRRACRIFPLYFFVLLITFAICEIGIGQHTEWQFNLGIPFWTYLIYCQNIFIALKQSLGNRWISHTWSLALEEQFYLILPLLIFFSNKKTLLVILVGCIVLAPLCRHYSSNWYQSFNLIYCRFDSLFSGVLIAILLNNSNSLAYLNKHKKLFDILFILSSLITIWFTLKKGYLNYYLANSWFAFYYDIILIILLINPHHFLTKFSMNKLLIFFGVISYGLYLYHPIIAGLIHFLIKNQEPQILNFTDAIWTIISFAVTVGVASLSYVFFEKRSIRIGQRFHY